MRRISYREIGGYKYKLTEDCGPVAVQTGIRPRLTIRTRYVVLYDDGILRILPGYAWDGPSGPTFDTPAFMRGSLYHDALYQLMSEGHIPWRHQEAADRLLWKTCREDGMGRLRAWYVRKAVNAFGKRCAQSARKRRKLVYWAP